MADYFEECVKLYNNPKSVSNWLMGEVSRYLNEQKIEITEFKIKPNQLTPLLGMLDAKKITSSSAKDVWAEMLASGKSADEIINAKGLGIVNDQSAIEVFAKQAITSNPRIVADYKGGKKAALQSLIGQVMKLSKGKANPELAKQALEKQLNG
jgi:aspartyl-tRNA(Asn)/glutamyl-tRNA(Gln) amidotransferase subunit B